MLRKGHILITDDVHPYLIEGLQDLGYDCDYRPQVTLEQVHQMVHGYQGMIINTKVRTDKILLDKARRLRFIGRLGSGLDIIDLAYAAQLGIQVISSPEGNCNAVGEHALGMLLSLCNKIPGGNREVKDFQWHREANRGIELKGRTVGIIGYGHTGPAFADKLRGFDVRCLAYDRFKEDYLAPDHYVEEVDLVTLQQQADIISLHVSLNETSHHLVDRRFIQACRHPFILINTSRGAVVNTPDLVWALEEGRVLGACLDVFENEKPQTFSHIEKSLYSRLYQFDQVIVTPHVAGWTIESKRKIAETLVQKIALIDQRDEPQNMASDV